MHHVEILFQRNVGSHGKQNIAAAAKEKVALVKQGVSVFSDADGRSVLADWTSSKRRRRVRVVECEPGRQFDGHRVFLGPGIVKINGVLTFAGGEERFA